MPNYRVDRHCSRLPSLTSSSASSSLFSSSLTVSAAPLTTEPPSSPPRAGAGTLLAPSADPSFPVSSPPSVQGISEAAVFAKWDEAEPSVNSSTSTPSVTVIPESNQDADHSITPEVDDLRTQAELASPGQAELGKRTYGLWQCPDGFIRWGMGIVSNIAEDVVLDLVEAGPVTQAAAGTRKNREVGREEAETYTGRDPVDVWSC
ncbi:hypothetical protein BJX65DRAFT_310375 [Aspergillus insuetus]